MPITKSAKKALRQNVRHHAANVASKNRLHVEIKKFRALISQKKLADAKTKLPLLYKLLDKAAKKHVVNLNVARRQKSRLARLLKP